MAFESIPEAQRMEFTRQVLTWKAEGIPCRVMAEKLGIGQKALESRLRKPWFARISGVFEDERKQREEATDPEAAAITGARRRIARLMSGPGIEFLESCLAKEGGKFVSRADARYAVDRLLPATGLNEAEDSRRRLGDIKLGVIMAQMEAIRKSDAAFHTRPAVTVEALPAPAPRAPELEGEDEGNDLDEVGMPESPSPVPPE